MPDTVLEGHRPAHRTDWLLPPFFMLRLAGLPFDSIVLLRFPDTVDWAERTLALEHDLRLAKDPLADALQAAVGALPDETLRRRVLEIRRDVFNLRLPRRPADGDAVVRALGGDVGDRLAGWLADRRRLADLQADGERVLAAELLARRRHLRELAGHPHLRHGLLLASPSLDRYLPTYLSAADGRLGKRSRRIERSLLEYVYRTAAKTSPFSTLTAVELGRLTDDPAGELLDLDGLPAQWRSWVRLNLATLTRIVDLVLTAPDLRADLPLQVTSGWRQDRDRIRYVRRQQTIGAEDSPVTMDRLRENLFFLSSGEVLDEVLAALPDGSAVRFGELSRRLSGAAPDRRRPADVDLYLQHLLRLGLLTVPTLHLDIHHPDPLADFARRLLGLGRPWATGLAERLTTVAEHVRGYADADLDERRRLLDAVRSELGEAQHDLGRDEATTPRTLIYEDATLGGAQVTASGARWRRDLLPAMQGLARVLPVFDMVLPQRLVTRGFFRARYGAGGRCADVVRFVHEFHQDFYEHFLQASMTRREFDADGEYVSQPNWLRLPELDALDAARRELIRRMRERYASLPPGAELVLDEDFVDGVAALLPELPGDLDPHCFFLQVGADATGAPLAVLNRAYTGLTLLFSRFAHCFPAGPTGGDLASGMRAALAAVQPPGAVFAELKGGYETTNLNLHPAVTPYELVCPGDTSFRDPAEQIPVDDLVIVDDPAGNQLTLRSQRLGIQVIPVYLGFLMPLGLPEVQRLLLNFSPTAMARIDLWSGTDRPLGDAPIGGHPRVRYRNLVVQRRLWKTAPDRLPQRQDGQSDADWMLAWIRWARENGLPRRVFVTPDVTADRAADPGTAGEDPGGRPALAGGGKPQYVDFDSFFSLTLLENTARAASHRLVFTEMTPDQDELWLRPGGDRYVSELTVEVDGLRRRTP